MSSDDDVDRHGRYKAQSWWYRPGNETGSPSSRFPHVSLPIRPALVPEVPRGKDTGAATAANHQGEQDGAGQGRAVRNLGRSRGFPGGVASAVRQWRSCVKGIAVCDGNGESPWAWKQRRLRRRGNTWPTQPSGRPAQLTFPAPENKRVETRDCWRGPVVSTGGETIRLIGVTEQQEVFA